MPTDSEGGGSDTESDRNDEGEPAFVRSVQYNSDRLNSKEAASYRIHANCSRSVVLLCYSEKIGYRTRPNVGDESFFCTALSARILNPKRNDEGESLIVDTVGLIGTNRIRPNNDSGRYVVLFRVHRIPNQAKW